MIRILHCVNDMHRAGLETMLMNYYHKIDRSKIQFDFLTHRPYRSDYDDEIESLGGKIYYAPRLMPQNYCSYFRYMKKFFLEHPEYKIIHSHIDSMSFLPLLAAKKAGVPVRIAHSHNTSIDKDYKYILKQIFKKNICNVTTDFLACGDEAGRFLFKNREFDIIPNSVDANAFIYDESKRNNKRTELGLNSNNFVLGHVGRISYQKNHSFLLKVFFEILKSNSNAVLLIIGTGEDEERIKREARNLGVYQSVKFLGVRSDVSELYQAMDAFVLPSLFEGVPVVGIEAQFAGLPCFFSAKVPREVQFSQHCSFLDLQLSPAKWSGEIIQSCNNWEREKNLYLDSKYRIENAKSILENYYIDLLKERGIDK